MSNKDLSAGRKIILGDGAEIVVKPLTLRQLRKFIQVTKTLNLETDSLTDEDINNMVEAASIALEKAAPDLAADKEALEDVVDVRVFASILEAAMGADPEE